MTSTQGDQYGLSWGYTARIRLNLQHCLWKDDAGYLLHPSISTRAPDLKIADIGTGTGIWLTDLAKTLPASVQLDGFDIDASQAAPKAWLPANVAVHALDCLEPFPVHLHKQYDIVHIQLFILAIANRDPEPILKNMISLLKPGGYITWGEYDYKTWQIISTRPEPPPELNALSAYVGTLGNTRSASWTANHWPARLPQMYADAGLVDIIEDRHPFPMESVPSQLDASMVATTEFTYNVLDKLGGGQGDVARDMIQKISLDRQNTGVNHDRLTVVGRKPLH